MSIWSQFFPPSPSFTNENVGSQTNKVFIITGGASGVGFEVASMLYSTGAKIYIAGRSEKNAHEAISRIKQNYESASSPLSVSVSTLHFLYIDLSDLKTIRPAAEEFLRQESRLNVLWNNAGVGATFKDDVSAQGLPIQFTTNCVAPQLFTKLLQPALERAQSARVVWAASTVVDTQSPKGGMRATDFEQPNIKEGVYNYTVSKVGNWFLASEFARREQERVHLSKDTSTASSESEAGLASSAVILHVAVNPGNLRTAVWRTWSWLFVKFLSVLFLYDARFGAYSELYAGLSSELSKDDNGGYVVPWGRKHPCPRGDILWSLKGQAEGGDGLAARFYDWCEMQASGF